MDFLANQPVNLCIKCGAAAQRAHGLGFGPDPLLQALELEAFASGFPSLTSDGQLGLMDFWARWPRPGEALPQRSAGVVSAPRLKDVRFFFTIIFFIIYQGFFGGDRLGFHGRGSLNPFDFRKTSVCGGGLFLKGTPEG